MLMKGRKFVLARSSLKRTNPFLLKRICSRTKTHLFLLLKPTAALDLCAATYRRR